MQNPGGLIPAMASRIEVWPLGRLVPYEKNSRTHTPEQVSQIAASILQFGFTQPILVDEVSGQILAGHARLRAARQLGMPEVPVVPLGHLTDAQRKAYIIADNKLALNAGWDDGMLQIEMQALMDSGELDLTVMGFSDKELEAILDASGDAVEGETDADDAPAATDEAVTRRGDLWLLGNHRLLCGDATNATDAATVLDGEKANLVLTDPPYNVDYFHSARSRRAARTNGRREKLHDVIAEDAASPEDFQDFLDGAMRIYADSIIPEGSMYCFMAFMRHTAFEAALEGAGFVIRCHLVWAKNHFVLTYNRYKQQHEGILYCHLKGKVDAWYGDKTQATVWLQKKPQSSISHPTMKPVELLERALANSTRRGDIVIDFFGGSGSTMIACERMGRKSRLIEIEPIYCDVILKRWANHTKRQPILASSGSTFLQIERERLVIEKERAPMPTGAPITTQPIDEAETDLQSVE